MTDREGNHPPRRVYDPRHEDLDLLIPEAHENPTSRGSHSRPKPTRPFSYVPDETVLEVQMQEGERGGEFNIRGPR
jgi:hypothetical protein